MSSNLAMVLLLLHVCVLGLFMARRLYAGRMWDIVRQSLSRPLSASGTHSTISTEFVLLTLFTSNFIGIVFCRSLHFQFYWSVVVVCLFVCFFCTVSVTFVCLFCFFLLFFRLLESG